MGELLPVVQGLPPLPTYENPAIVRRLGQRGAGTTQHRPQRHPAHHRWWWRVLAGVVVLIAILLIVLF